MGKNFLTNTYLYFLLGLYIILQPLEFGFVGWILKTNNGNKEIF